MEIIGGLVVIAIAFYVLKGFFNLISGPKVDDYFTCSSCGTRARHDSRTISAWKSGLRSSVCGACHSDWRRTQKRGVSFGCLGWLSLIVLVVAAIIIVL